MAIKTTYTQDKIFDTEEEMSFDDLTIPGDYSDCAILEKYNLKYIQKWWIFWKNKKRNMERKVTVN